jgi:hypothetical protein
MGALAVLGLSAIAWIAPSEPERPAGLSAATSPSTAGTTTTAVAATTTTAGRAGDDGPKNLLANAGFENGPQGWQAVGGARLTRSSEAKEGGWSLRILPDGSADGPVGITVPDATVTKLAGRYHTNAWVRPSAPGATVTIGLREYRDGRPVPGSNTLGWTVERVGWRQFGAIHVATSAGSQLTLEIMARDLPPGGYVDVDDVVLHQLGR